MNNNNQKTNELLPRKFKQFAASFSCPRYKYEIENGKMVEVEHDIDTILDGLFLEYIFTKNNKKLESLFVFMWRTKAESEQILNHITDEVHVYYFKYLWLKYAIFVRKLDAYLDNISDAEYIDPAYFEQLQFLFEEHMRDVEERLEDGYSSPLTRCLETKQIKMPEFNIHYPRLPRKLPDWSFKEELTKHFSSEGVI